MDKQKEETKKTSFAKEFIQKSLMALITPAVVFTTVKNIMNFLYQNECQDLYHLPGKYFSIDTIPSVTYILFTLVLIFASMAPSVFNSFRKPYEDNQKYNPISSWLIYTILVGLAFGALNALLILSYYEQNDEFILYKLASSFAAFSSKILPFIQKDEFAFVCNFILLTILCFMIAFIAMNGLLFIDMYLPNNVKKETIQSQSHDYTTNDNNEQNKGSQPRPLKEEKTTQKEATMPEEAEETEKSKRTKNGKK